MQDVFVFLKQQLLSICQLALTLAKYLHIIACLTVPLNKKLIFYLFFLLSLRSVVLRIACGLTAFIFQYNVVCLDVPLHICPSVVGVCHGIGNRVDKLHLGIVRIVLDRDFRWDRYLYRAFLLTALQIIGSTLDFLGGRPVLILYTVVVNLFCNTYG